MTDTVARGGVEPTLRARGPAYSVIQECLRIQADAPPAGRLAKALGKNPLHPQAVNWYRGALGEIEVAAILARLGPEWTVLHAVPVGAGESDIDHVLIGPPGIFTINTKNPTSKKIFAGGGSVKVDGHGTDFVRNSRFEAKRAAILLGKASGTRLTVTPLIVFAGTDRIARGKKPSTVDVLAAQQLLRWLEARSRQLSDEAVTYYSMVAEERGTWHDVASDPSDTLRHVQRFERLQADIAAALRRRRHWVAAGIAITLLGIPVVVFGAAGIVVTLLARLLT